MIIIRAAVEESKTPAAARKDAPSLPAAAAPLIGNNDPVKLHKELRELFGAELDAALKEKEK